MLSLGVATLFALMLGLVAFQARIAQDQLRLDRVESELREAEARFAQLRLEVARLESPDRIVAEAERLGMQRPGPDEITYLAPPAGVAAEVLAAGGPQPAAGPAGTGSTSRTGATSSPSSAAAVTRAPRRTSAAGVGVSGRVRRRGGGREGRSFRAGRPRRRLLAVLVLACCWSRSW